MDIATARGGPVTGRSDAGYLALRSRSQLRLLPAHQALVHGLPRDAEHGCGDTLVAIRAAQCFGEKQFLGLFRLRERIGKGTGDRPRYAGRLCMVAAGLPPEIALVKRQR
jgi:hypothetical protein